MEKNGTVKRSISAIVFSSLLISSLPATLPVRAQQPIIQQVVSKVSKKLSKKEINKKLRNIKKAIRIFQAVNIIVPILITGAGIIIFLSALGVVGFALKKHMDFFDKLKDRDLPSKLEVEIKRKARLELDPEVKQTLKLLSRQKIADRSIIVAALVAIGAFFVTPVFTVLSAVGLFGGTVLTAFLMTKQLKQMEKDHPGTLTKKQKDILVQFKNLANRPVIRGAMKSHSLRKTQRMEATSAMEKNPVLGATIAFGQPKKARKIIARYIKLKWMEQNAQNAVSQMAKTTTPGRQKVYEKAVKELQKTEQKVKNLEAKHPPLAKTKEVKDAVQAFSQKADDIIGELKTPVIEKEMPEPMVVPL